jgi:glycosyltransferase involved in cell wall biosynthesis
MDIFTNITGVTVHYNTPELLSNALQSIDNNYKLNKIITINNGGDINYVCTNNYMQILDMTKNVGHGLGLNAGLYYVNTDYALIFDSDTEIIKPEVLKLMIEKINNGVYAVGKVSTVDKDGNDDINGFKYVHPFFMLLNMSKYRKYPPFIHHGAPLIKTMYDMRDHNTCEHFDPQPYVYHKWAGTREQFNNQVPGTWETI